MEIYEIIHNRYLRNIELVFIQTDTKFEIRWNGYWSRGAMDWF